MGLACIADDKKWFVCVKRLDLEVVLDDKVSGCRGKYVEGEISRSIAIPELEPTMILPETWRGNEHSVFSPAAKFPHSGNILRARVNGRNVLGPPGAAGDDESSLLQREFAHRATPAELIPDLASWPASVNAMIIFGVEKLSPSEL